ncbi:unnamed protein product [Orchesella dallaii]|uniref:Uncharacterized protein n=1 Tax=Orchesella dallaii TaxID=48710 RepID=A0ABP1RNF1_9HEXA
MPPKEPANKDDSKAAPNKDGPKAGPNKDGHKAAPNKDNPKAAPKKDDPKAAPKKDGPTDKKLVERKAKNEELAKKKAKQSKKLMEQLEHTSIDLSGADGKRFFCKKLHASLSPLRGLLSIFGRFPVTNTSLNEDGTYEYEASCSSMSVFHFNITTLILLYAFGVGIFNTMSLTLDFIPHSNSNNNNESSNATRSRAKQLLYDQALVQRHTIPLIIVFTTLLQGCLSSIFFTRKRHYLAHIFGFMNKAAYTLHMDIAGKVTDFTVQSTVICTVITCLFIMLGSLKFGPSSIGTPTVFGSLMVRLYLGSKVWLEYEPNKFGIRQVIEIIGGLMLVIIFVSSIAPMLLFIYKCKILRKALACWNGRAYCALLRGTEFAQTEDCRMTYNFLFKDHCVLMDLVDSVDQMYAFTIESFFILQIISFCFQLYFFFRVGTEGVLFIPYAPIKYEKKYFYVRPYDWIPALLILLTTAALLCACGKAAAKVGEEAEAGFEVLRRKGMIGRKTDQELEFMFSMCFSFSNSLKKCEIAGAGYLYYNKGFMMQMFAVTLFCFMLLLQFHPYMEYYPQVFQKDVADKFLRRLEGTGGDAVETNWMNGTLWVLRQ